MSRKATSKKVHKDRIRRKLRRAENRAADTAPLREKTLGAACRRLYKGGLAII